MHTACTPCRCLVIGEITNDKMVVVLNKMDVLGESREEKMGVHVVCMQCACSVHVVCV